MIHLCETVILIERNVVRIVIILEDASFRHLSLNLFEVTINIASKIVIQYYLVILSITIVYGISNLRNKCSIRYSSFGPRFITIGLPSSRSDRCQQSMGPENFSIAFICSIVEGEMLITLWLKLFKVNNFFLKLPNVLSVRCFGVRKRDDKPPKQRSRQHHVQLSIKRRDYLYAKHYKTLKQNHYSTPANVRVYLLQLCRST